MALILILLMSQTLNANSCNQKLYDKLYKQIVKETLNGQSTIEERNRAIRALRRLCKGQLSSYERPRLKK